MPNIQYLKEREAAAWLMQASKSAGRTYALRSGMQGD